MAKTIKSKKANKARKNIKIVSTKEYQKLKALVNAYERNWRLKHPKEHKKNSKELIDAIKEVNKHKIKTVKSKPIKAPKKKASIKPKKKTGQTIKTEIKKAVKEKVKKIVNPRPEHNIEEKKEAENLDV